ncbi:DMT family transporter [Acidipropionibacterium virtanenii]|uniref:4-amino-4-deoxy-L-arabinose-phosphoundecaprenol flippase subunit ArnE n=1 Tax=Acidipropionibacterium virtanenii TaxID=2057246 RepID=A0A344UW63_9ACTN|nr:DMT family transporter [Acidipropionibacterium virtanenii]AXE39511.1 4-amino-4-deoxy-L-arabinose-phosphoundecaprenol flippase subunit ArnE [Acidipropionibacterium virtanenii]
MGAASIALVLVAAVAHAIWNTAAKFQRGDPVLFVWAYTCAATLLCLPVGLAPVLDGSQPLDRGLAAAALVSAGLHIVYSLTLQGGYDRFDMGVVYPVARGTGPVLSMIVAIALLGEQPHAVELAGAVVVVAGICVVAGNPFSGGQSHPLRGVMWGAATGAAIACYTLWDSWSVRHLDLAATTYFTGTYLIQSLVLTPRALRRRTAITGSLRTNWRPVLIVAVFSPLAYILVLHVMRTAPVAIVAPLRESSIVIGSVLAWRLFGEGHLARRLVGAAIVLAGIALISL